MVMYQLFMLVLCVFALAILLLQGAFRNDAEVLQVLHYADDFLCIAFLVDFGISLARAPNKWRYLVTWGWLDLLSSLPALDMARWGRLARVVRVARVLRGLRAGRRLGQILYQRRRHSAAVAAALLAVFLVIGSSAAILRFEDDRASNIRTADDAVWWAFATITTVGYGDLYPVTAAGRVVAAVLMTAGVGLFGVFSATLAAWFLAPEDDDTDEELTGLRKEVAALRKVIEERV